MRLVFALILALAPASVYAHPVKRVSTLLSGTQNRIPSSTPPLSYKASFLTWRQQRVNYLVNRASTASTPTTYYFSATGSDSNDGLSSGTPKQNLSTLSSLATAGSKIEFLLKRGDTFRGEATFPTSGNFKLRAYGSGAKPVITKWLSTGYLESDNAWTNVSGNLYKKTTPPPSFIGWIRETASPYNPYTYLTSSTNVGLLPYSFHQATGSSGTFTANASNEQITSTAHGLSSNDRVTLSTTGTLPGGLSVQTTYFVISVDANTFQLSASSGPGSAVNITSTGTGTHTWTKAGDLFINAGSGINPNDVNFEVVPDRNPLSEGIRAGITQTETTGTGQNTLYVEDIVIDGHGVSTDTNITLTAYGIAFSTSGTDISACVRCESYYNGRHAIANTSTGGGIAVYKDCTGGYGSVDATTYVSYAGSGGFESHWQDCDLRFGKLPGAHYTDTFGAVYAGGPSSSAFTSHTAGGASKIGLLTVHGLDFQDNRATYPRATYEVGLISANDAPGTFSDLSSYRVFYNHDPIVRISEKVPATVTVDTGTDFVTHTAHGMQDGDMVNLRAATTIPGGVTTNQLYGVINSTTDTYQLGSVALNISSINTTTDTITLASAHGLSNGDRVKVDWHFGQIAGGLDQTTLYYVVGASGSDLQLSLTLGGAAVDITDVGFGRGRIYGRIVNITSTGSGTITAEGVDVHNSAFVQQAQIVPAVHINNRIEGLQYAVSGGSASNDMRFNNLTYFVNPGLSTGVLYSPGGQHFHGHYKVKSRGSFGYLHNGANASALLFNSIIDWTTNTNSVSDVHVPNATASMRGNAIYDTSGDLAALTSNDDYRVTLTSSPTRGATPGATFDTEGYPSPNSIPLEYDFNGNARNTATPSIGPIR